MGKKATKLEQATRIETVRQLILSGVEHTRIVQQVSAQWKITERQGWRYLSQAQDRIIAITLPSREYMLAEHVSVRRSIRERARQAKDLRAELAAAQDEAKLFGLYVERIEHSGPGGGPVEITTIEVVKDHSTVGE